MTEDNGYTYPGSSIFRNKLGINRAARLEAVERRLVVQRATEGIPRGRFGLAHLRAIRRHLFQDLYDRASMTGPV